MYTDKDRTPSEPRAEGVLFSACGPRGSAPLNDRTLPRPPRLAARQAAGPQGDQQGTVRIR